MKKYFQLVECWAWCEICKDMISLSVDKKEIVDGLQAGFYKKKWIHRNPFPDLDDPEDQSGKDHSVYIYINQNYDITGVKSFYVTGDLVNEAYKKF